MSKDSTAIDHCRTQGPRGLQPGVIFSACLLSVAFSTLSPGLKAEPSDDERRARVLEEVVVKARRKDEFLKDVPASITAFSGLELEQFGISGIKDLAIASPGIVVNESGGFGRIFIRGFGSNAFVPFVDPTVAVLIDGAYAPAATSAVQRLGNVQSVEVLKGPQGTLFGRNTTAGAVQIHTQDPSDELAGKVSLAVGSRKHKEASVYVSAPLFNQAEAFSAGLALGGFVFRVDSHEENTLSTAPPLRPTRDQGAFAKLVIDYSDWLSLVATGIYSDHDGAAGGTFFQAQKTGLINPGKPDTEPRTGANNVDPFGKSESTMYSLRLSSWNDALSFWVQGTQNDTALMNQFDGDGTGVDQIYNNNTYAWDAKSLEAQLSSNGDWSLFGMSYEWMIGAFHFAGDAIMDPVVFGIPLNLLPTALGIPVDTQGTAADAAANFDIGGTLYTEAVGYFANLSLDIFEWLSVDLGLRYSSEDRTAMESTAALRLLGAESLLPTTVLPQSIRLGDLPFDFNLGGEGLVLRDAEPQTLSFKNTSPLAGINIHLPDDSLFYFKYSEGFKAGTWNLITLFEDPSPVPEETVRSREVGYKTDFFDRQLQINLALFEMNYRGLQAYQVALVETGSAVVRSIDKSRTRGAEFESKAYFPLNFLPGDDGKIRLGLTYLDGEIQQWRNAPTFDKTTYQSKTEDNLAGNTLHSAPMWSVNIDLGYGFDLDGGRLEMGLGYYYNDGIYYDPQNFIEQDAYELVNARISYEIPAWNLNLMLFGRNLTDTNYRTYGQVYDFGEMVGWAPASSTELKASWRF